MAEKKFCEYHPGIWQCLLKFIFKSIFKKLNISFKTGNNVLQVAPKEIKKNLNHRDINVLSCQTYPMLLRVFVGPRH